MGNFWLLSNIQKQKGQLDCVRDFLGITDRSEISCCQVIVPISIDVKNAIQSASNILGIPSKNNPYHNTIRSFEIWWDGTKRQLKIVLASHSPKDLESFKTAFSQMYPNATYLDLKTIVPEWYFPVISKKEKDYSIFDVSTHHGHYSTIFDKSNAHDTLTRVSNTIQLARYAWIQFVFAPYNFTPYLKSHHNQLNRRIKLVTSKKFRNWIDELKNTKPYENPENGMDFYNHYRILQSDTSQKMQKSQVIMSIRGLLSSESNESDDDNNNRDNNNNSLESIPFDDIKSSYEHLAAYTYDTSKFYNSTKPKKAGSPITISGVKRPYERQSMFELRLIPAVKKPLENAINNYFNTSKLTGDYKTRKPLPFLVLNNDEMSLFVHLPDAVTTKNLQTSRNVSLPSRLTSKKGFNLGYLQESKTNFNQYGKIVKSTDDQHQCSVIAPADFSRHGYIVGGTGSGKTTLLRIIAKHLENSNLNGEFPNSFIYLDPKGDDSLKFIEQCDRQSIEHHNVHFLDPIETDFSINPLELPRYSPEKRQETVSRYVGYFMDILKEWYKQQQSFVQMERIFRVLLFYMYQNNDAPTFLDMYDIIINIQEEQEKFLQIMFKALGMPDSEAMKQALTSIATLRPESFVPLLNRVEQFATDPILKKVFCIRHGTVKFEDLIKPNQYTIVRISSLHLAHHIQPLAIQAFVIKLWFTIQERASHTAENDRNYVVLALDEFQIVSDLHVLPMILSQARSYRLGLLLAHQTTAQISDSLLEEITGNCGTQLAGRISGKDASKLASIWDPRFSKEIQQQLASQEDYHWTIKMRAEPGKEQPTPLQFWLHNPPSPNLNENEQFLDNFVSEQKRLYGNYDDNDKRESSFEEEDNNSSILQQKQIQRDRWMRYLTVSLPTKEQWQIMVALHKNKMSPLQLTEITEQVRAETRDDVLSILKKMIEKGILEKDDSTRNVKYFLSKKAVKNYFTLDDTKIGTAKDISRITQKVIKNYLDKGVFITIASQNIEKDKYRPDLIGYHYDEEKSISIEIESTSELASHPEHARLNMEKWKNMGFDICHCWSESKKLLEVYDSQVTNKKNVKAFLI